MKILTILAAAAAIAVPGLAQAKTGVTFLIVGDTLTNPFSFKNTSDAGEKIIGFGFDMSPITAEDLIFDTEGAGSTPLTPVNNSAATTGLTAVPYIPDNAKSFMLAFTDFNPSETFAYRIDVDVGFGGSISGQRLIGAKVYFDYDNGTRVEGFLQAVPGQTNASTFVTDRVVNTAVPEPAAWALMITGFGLAGSAVRRSRRAQALA